MKQALHDITGRSCTCTVLYFSVLYCIKIRKFADKQASRQETHVSKTEVHSTRERPNNSKSKSFIIIQIIILCGNIILFQLCNINYIILWWAMFLHSILQDFVFKFCITLKSQEHNTILVLLYWTVLYKYSTTIKRLVNLQIHQCILTWDWTR